VKTNVKSKEATRAPAASVRAFRSAVGLTHPKTAARLLKALYIIDEPYLPLIYGPQEQRDIAELVEICAPSQTRESIQNNLHVLADVEVILSGWHAPLLDEAFLTAAPKLQAVFYGAGSTRYFTTEEFWKRDIVLTSAAAANAIPVAEYTQSVIVLSLKHFWRFAAHAKSGGAWGDSTRSLPGVFRKTVGLISLGTIGRLVRERLRPFDLRVIAYDPYLTADEAARMDIRPVSLEQLFREADVVSLHTPWLKETEGMITGAHFGSMKRDATFINTARGAIVREPEMARVLLARPDLTAVLDVTHPEPPAPDSLLLRLPNIVLTPHIAGSMGAEINRLGHYMVEELRRFLAGEPLRWQIAREAAATLA